jgi:hypothetical protein
MVSKKYKYGVLNPGGPPEKGNRLDPSNFSGSDWLIEAVRKNRTPSFIRKMSGPLLGICLRVEKSPGEKGFFSSFSSVFGSDEDTPELTIIRARIPEIHAHLPDPTCYGPEGLNTVISLYPEFISQKEFEIVPAPGDLVWLDFKDRENFQDPIYLGKMDNTSRQGGFSCRKPPSSSNPSRGPAQGKLGLNAPSGDPVGGTPVGATGQVPSTSPRYDPAGKVGGTEPELVLPESIGKEPAFRNGQKIGEIDIAIWTNPDGTKRKVARDSIPSLVEMDDDMQQSLGLRLYVNSGFRTNSEQKILFDRYKRGQGNKSARPGFSRHQRGRAIDFAVYDSNKRGKKRQALAANQKAWKWFNKNAKKYSFTWDEGRQIGEPWHWNYVGRINGLEDGNEVS